jgi:hypothetical protein
MALQVKSKSLPGEPSKPQNVLIVDSEDPDVKRFGTWSSVADRDASHLTYIVSNTPGDYVEYKFKGTGLWLRVYLSADAGKAKISIDDGTPITIDLYSSTTRLHTPFVHSNLSPPPNQHTVKIEVDTTKNASSSDYKVGIDAFIIELSRGAVQMWAMIETAIETVTELAKFGDVIPDVDLMRKLGDSTHRWLEAYIRYFLEDVLPGTDATYNLGTLSKRWKGLYLSDTINQVTIPDAGYLRIGTTSGAPEFKFDEVTAEYASILLQPSAGNIRPALGLIPKGTGNRAQFWVGNVDSLTDYGFFNFEILPGYAVLETGRVGAGTAPAFLKLLTPEVCIDNASIDGGTYPLLTFGAARDTNLYRLLTDVLKTDDNFDALALRIGGTEVITSARVLQNLSGLANISGVISDTQHGSRGSGLHADSHARLHTLDSASDHSGSITDAQHGSRGSGLHADSHARSHDHSLAADGSPIAEAGVPVLTDAKYPNALLRDGSRSLTGNVVPDGTNSRNIGSASLSMATVYSRNFWCDEAGVATVFGGASGVYFGAGGAYRFMLSPPYSYALTPYADNTYDIGYSNLRIKKIYAVSTNWGEVGFSDTICRKCAEPFKVGDEVVLKVFEIKAGYIETAPVHKDCVEKAFKPLAEDEYEVINEAVLDEGIMQLNVRFGDGLFAAIPVKIDCLGEEVEETIRKYHNNIKADREKKEKAVKEGESKKKVSWKGRKGKIKV